MKKTVYLNEFVEDMTREGYGFSYKGAVALFNYFEEQEEECGIDIEYDPIAFRCEYTEYDSIDEVFENYYTIRDDHWTDEEYKEADEEEKIEYLRGFTQVIELDNGGIIIQDF